MYRSEYWISLADAFVRAFSFNMKGTCRERDLVLHLVHIHLIVLKDSVNNDPASGIDALSKESLAIAA